MGGLIDRRAALCAGGLVAANALVGRGLNRQPPVLFGVNRRYWHQAARDIPRLGAVRIYQDTENDIPPRWPREGPALVTLSIRPHPADLLSGELDAAIGALLASAPPHSELTFWHENTSGNPLGYPSYVNNPRAAVAIQRYGQRLCRGTNVAFGVITCGPAVQQHDFVAPGLDWYGDDIYEFPRLRDRHGQVNKAKLIHRLEVNLAFWRQKSGRKWPRIRACESNSPFDEQRVRWFTWLTTWMAWHNGRRLITYWNPDQGVKQGGLSGPWPPGEETRRCLRRLSDIYPVT
jgi:hypothetical protein